MTTVQEMQKLAKLGRTDEGIRARARDLIQLGGPRAIRQWLSRRFIFVPDPFGIELVKTPGAMLEEYESLGHMQGDCDDAAILGASIAHAAGYPVRFQLLGFEKGGPFSHVYAEARDRLGHWVDLDVTRPAQFPPGLRVFRRRAINL